jgi:putative transposase
MKRSRRNHSPAFKAKIALQAIRGDKTLSELAQQHQVHPTQITAWKQQLLEHAAELFANGQSLAEDSQQRVQELHAKIGELTMERDFLSSALGRFRPERQALIDREANMPITTQCQLLGLSRSSAYYRPRPVSASDLALMRRLDELHLEHPFLGARKLTRLLKDEGHPVGRRHVTTLMHRMGLEAIYRKPRLSLPDQAHKIYPYLLSQVVIERPNQVWAADITYLPMAKGFVYLVAILDLYSRKVVAWRTNNTLTSDFCVEALQEALRRFGRPEIFNTDQGSQFTAEAFTDVLKAHHIAISMDGKGRWVDNVFIERLWRSVKYEEIYLHAYEMPREVNAALTRYFNFYNGRRPHQSLDQRTPDAVYFAAADLSQAA